MPQWSSLQQEDDSLRALFSCRYSKEQGHGLGGDEPCLRTTGRGRTCNTRFWRPLLYQLSYRHRKTRACLLTTSDRGSGRIGTRLASRFKCIERRGGPGDLGTAVTLATYPRGEGHRLFRGSSQGVARGCRSYTTRRARGVGPAIPTGTPPSLLLPQQGRSYIILAQAPPERHGIDI
jgi:hypothetical protein